MFVPPGSYRFNGQITYSTSCHIVGKGRSPIFFRNYSSTDSSFGVGWIQLSASYISIENIEINGCNSVQGPCANAETGNCIVDTASNSNVRITGNYIHNCDGASILLYSTVPSSGPTNVTISENRIVGGANESTIIAQGIVSDVAIINNERIDASAVNFAAGNAAINLQAGQGTGKLTNFLIANNKEIVPACNSSWGIQAGPFNGLTFSGLKIVGNNFDAACSTAGFISTPATYGHLITNNTMQMHYLDLGYVMGLTAIELGGASSGIIAHNICYCESSGNVSFIDGDTGSGNLIDANESYGLGEGAGYGIILTDSTASQAISTVSETSNVVTVTVSGSLNSAIQPGVSLAICNTTPSCNPSTYFGYYTVIDSNYSRSGGTFSYIDNLGTGFSCSSSCGSIYFGANNNTVTNNVIVGPVGALTAASVAFFLRGQVASAVINNNVFKNNTYTGTSVSNEYCMDESGTFVLMDNNLFDGNTCINAGIGLNLGGSGATNTRARRNSMVNVGTPFSYSTGGTISELSDNGFAAPATDIASCGASLLGLKFQSNDNASSPGFGATYTTTGSSNVTLTCNGTNWTVSAQ